MGSPSDEDVHKYAEFLVQVFPETAIDILVDDEICEQAKIQKKIERLCNRLGKRTIIDGLILNRQFDKLREMVADMRGGDSSAPSTPGTSRHTGLDLLAGPPTPSSMASGPQGLHRKTHHPLRRQITVLHKGDEYPLLFSESGTDSFFIEEDKLARFRGLHSEWVNPSQRVELGGRMIYVAHAVDLTWSHELEPGSRFNRFWVVRSGTIKQADVLVASGRGPSNRWDEQASPQGFNLHARPPAPNPPPAFQAYGSSSGLQSEPTSPATSSRAMRHSNYGPPPDIPRQAPPHHTSQGSRTMPPHASTVGSPGYPTPSHRAARASATENLSAQDGGSTAISAHMVTVAICLQVAPEAECERSINLNAAAADVLAKIKSSFRRRPDFGRLDWTQLELIVSPMGTDKPSRRSMPLDEAEFADSWASTVKFMRRNRTPELDGDPEFSFDIV